MDKGYPGDDSERSQPTGAISTKADTRWGAHRGASAGDSSKRTSAAATAATRDKATPVRRVRPPESSSPEVANELGFRDTTVIDDDVPEQLRPKSHKRKADSQAPEPATTTVPLTPDFSGILLGMIEGLTTAAWGEDARFTANERKLIQPPFGRILQRMSPDDAGKFTALADPVLLGTGLLIWGMRIWTMQQRAVRPTPTPIRPSGPVIQGMPESEVRTAHEPGPNGTRATANVPEHIVNEWGSI